MFKWGTGLNGEQAYVGHHAKFLQHPRGADPHWLGYCKHQRENTLRSSVRLPLAMPKRPFLTGKPWRYLISCSYAHIANKINKIKQACHQGGHRNRSDQSVTVGSCTWPSAACTHKGIPAVGAVPTCNHRQITLIAPGFDNTQDYYMGTLKNANFSEMVLHEPSRVLSFILSWLRRRQGTTRHSPRYRALVPGQKSLAPFRAHVQRLGGTLSDTREAMWSPRIHLEQGVTACHSMSQLTSSAEAMQYFQLRRVSVCGCSG